MSITRPMTSPKHQLFRRAPEASAVENPARGQTLAVGCPTAHRGWQPGGTPRATGAQDATADPTSVPATRRRLPGPMRSSEWSAVAHSWPFGGHAPLGASSSCETARHQWRGRLPSGGGPELSRGASHGLLGRPYVPQRHGAQARTTGRYPREDLQAPSWPVCRLRPRGQPQLSPGPPRSTSDP